MSERAPPPPIDTPKPSLRRRRLLFVGLAVVIPIVALVVIAGLLVTVMGWTTYHQPSGSMIPALAVGDRFFVDKRAYADGRRPDYGDVIIFRVSAQRFGPAFASAPFLKRVVGLPGDRVALAGGVVTVNGKPLPQTPIGEYAARPGQKQKAARVREQAPNGATYDILRYAKPLSPDTAGPYVVPQGHYFVLGDNRDDSIDSRYWVNHGNWYVPLASIIGRANFIYWSGSSRLDRIGTALK